MWNSKYQLFPSKPNPGDGLHWTNALNATPSTSSSTNDFATDKGQVISHQPTDKNKLSEEEIKRKDRAERKRRNEEEKGKLYAFVFIIKDTHVLFKKKIHILCQLKNSNNNMKIS